MGKLTAPVAKTQAGLLRVGSVVERVESVGTVRAREAVTITTKVAGIVELIRFTEGERMRIGALPIAPGPSR